MEGDLCQIRPGVDVAIDPQSNASVTGNTRSAGDQFGRAEFVLPIANKTSIRHFVPCAQYVWAGPTAPASCAASGLSASHGLHLIVQ